MPSQEEIEQQLKLLDSWRDTLAHYRDQHAQLGSAHVPPSIPHGIKEARKEIQHIKKVLRGWNVPFEDHDDGDREVSIPHMVPPHSPDWIDRSTLLTKLVESILDSQLPHGSTIALCGPGGRGKTILAAMICRHPLIKDRFEGGIFWVTLGRQAEVEQVAANLSAIMNEERCLIVLDDVRDEADLKWFQSEEASVVLITTQKRSFYARSIKRIDVEPMEPEDAVNLLSANLPPASNVDYVDLAARLYRNPLPDNKHLVVVGKAGVYFLRFVREPVSPDRS